MTNCFTNYYSYDFESYRELTPITFYQIFTYSVTEEEGEFQIGKFEKSNISKNLHRSINEKRSSLDENKRKGGTTGRGYIIMIIDKSDIFSVERWRSNNSRNS